MCQVDEVNELMIRIICERMEGRKNWGEWLGSDFVVFVVFVVFVTLHIFFRLSCCCFVWSLRRVFFFL